MTEAIKNAVALFIFCAPIAAVLTWVAWWSGESMLFAFEAQIPTEVRPLVLRIPTKLPRGFPTLLVIQSGWVLRALSLADAASDRVRLMGRGRRRLAPAS
jgi:hypothetical protein